MQLTICSTLPVRFSISWMCMRLQSLPSNVAAAGQDGGLMASTYDKVDGTTFLQGVQGWCQGAVDGNLAAAMGCN